MKKESTDETKTRRSPRLSSEQERDSSTTPSPGTAKDGRTRRTKRRRAGPEQKTSRKRAKVSGAENPPEEDLRFRVLKRKVSDDGEGAAKTTKKKKRRRLDLHQDESASSSADTESSGGGRRGGKRKAADHAGEGPNGKRTRTPDLKDDHREKDQEDHQEENQDPQEKDQEDHQVENQDPQEKDQEDHLEENQDPQEKDQEYHQEENQDPQEKDQEDHQEENQDPQEKDQEDHQEENQDHQEKDQEHQQDLTADSPSAEFESKYEQQEQLGEGGCGCVYAGFRKEDNLPVAIKHVPKDKTLGKYLDREGRQASVEVAIMQRLGAGTSGSAGTSGAPVSLLDWYDLGPKLILVMERPVPCVDLFDYVTNNGGSLQETEAKIILKQLVNAAKELEDQQIFHRDIKRENILIETGSEVPRVRLIDFGLGCFTKKRSLFRNFCGTPAHVPPEWYMELSYRAGPTTVWQMGVVLFDSLHRKVKFETTMFAAKKLRINRKLSKDCRDFLQMCLTLDPKRRPTLEQLQHHPWLT